MKLHQYLNPLHGWNDSSAVDKVRVYTRQSFLTLAVAVAVAAMLTSLQIDDYVSMAAQAVCAAATFVIVQRTPAIGGVSKASPRVPLVIMAVSAAVVAFSGEANNMLWAAALATTAVAALVPLRWCLAAAVASAALAAALGRSAIEALVLGLFIAFLACTLQLSAWLLRIVTELDATRDAAAALSVAEERLRFSRDLHDVVGRALSAIAVKSELAATLARRGDDRAAGQMDEVRILAQESMADARKLVRGYRSVDVASELDGARSLLSAAGISTELVGETSVLSERAAEAAAWVVREGVTNILRHSSATYCRIELTDNSIHLANDHPSVSSGRNDGTGLSGLRERLVAVGGALNTEKTSEEFTLTATLPTSPQKPRTTP
ncbi:MULTISPECIES: histidine kinase [unclassified Rhodococcus (in: high G+C Gram-positive bacteria)]|uniref:sensor histidine kinase n=1 Tax=unclassified Rhodococcus (in: high G+C Gram-positive bacteria) TaxID=192944 RepID=UPI0011EF7061|nr:MULTISPECIES: histidine kinase [unclassified Rhodococcus (in: high G+C Gram-positive bacteria)]KAA0927711.1 sensor histidine kinase [Rhodococcus sp. ANT_H53B]MDI9928048.1 histidine kinase [Rhodococcus sp. IEGM 1341]